MKDSVFAKRSDALIIGGLLLFCLAALLFFRLRPADEPVADIYLDNTLLASLPLDCSGDFIFPECPGVTVRVENGTAFFLSSDCPDQICVKTGPLKAPGACAVCLPNRMSIRVRARHEADAVLLRPFRREVRA